MSDYVENITVEILRSIQASITEFRSETTARFKRLETRIGALGALGASMRKDSRNGAGMLVMMRATAGDFDERVSEIEARVTAHETRV